MLDLPRLQSIHLSRVPPGQLLFAEGALRWDYLLPRRTNIILEGIEHIPSDRSVFLAMNHTDRYNYWPFQYQMHRLGLRYTATWVKGKYYENPLVSRFLDSMNNIPVPSRGYVISVLFRQATKRKPSEAEYRFLRDLVDGKIVPQADVVAGQSEAVKLLLKSQGDGQAQPFLTWFNGHFDLMIDEVLRIHREAVNQFDLNILVFPQGTRSIRLSKGHTGLVQMAQYLGCAIVPVGCNGSDRVYPGNSPLAKGGRIVYRIGKPLELEGPELAPHRVRDPYRPLTREATAAHNPKFAAMTDVVMHKINELLDPAYQFADGGSDGVQGVQRFM